MSKNVFIEAFDQAYWDEFDAMKAEEALNLALMEGTDGYKAIDEDTDEVVDVWDAHVAKRDAKVQRGIAHGKARKVARHA